MSRLDPFSDPRSYLLFMENQKAIPQEMLLPYQGMHIAWNAEGTRIVASGETYDVLFDQLESLGISGSEVRFDYVHRPGESAR